VSHLIALLVAGCLVFVSTNVDDTLLLAAFFAHPEFEARQVVLGQFAGMGVLIVGALLGSGAAALASPAHVGLLGFLPLGLGAWRLWRLHRPSPEETWAQQSQTRGARHALLVTIATISDGGDNLAAYVPYFTALSQMDTALTITLFLVLTAACCLAACFLVRHPATGAQLRRHGTTALPWVMIGLGAFILLRTGALGPP